MVIRVMMRKDMPRWLHYSAIFCGKSVQNPFVNHVRLIVPPASNIFFNVHLQHDEADD